MKKEILLVGFVCSIIMLSGCISETNVDTKKIKTGQLIDAVHNRGWLDFPPSVELFFFDMTSVKIEYEWFRADNGTVVYGLEKNNLHSFCKYNIGKNVTIIYNSKEGVCYSIELYKNPVIVL